jgi:hypothetical protein
MIKNTHYEAPHYAGIAQSLCRLSHGLESQEIGVTDFRFFLLRGV